MCGNHNLSDADMLWRSGVLDVHNLDVFVGVATLVHHVPCPGQGEFVVARTVDADFFEVDRHRAEVAVVHCRENGSRLQVLALHRDLSLWDVFHKCWRRGVHNGDELAGLFHVSAVVGRHEPALDDKVVGAGTGQRVDAHFEVGVRRAVVHHHGVLEGMFVAAFCHVILRNGQHRRLGVGHLNHLGVRHRIAARVLRVPRAGDGVVAWACRVSNGLVKLHRDEATIVGHREHCSVGGKSALHFHVFWGQFLVPFRIDGVDHGEGGGGGCSVATCVGGGEAHRDGSVASTNDGIACKVVGPRDVATVLNNHSATSRSEPRPEF